MSTRRVLLGMGTVIGAISVWAAPAAAAPPANTEAPSIAGTARVGQELTARNGTWSNTPTAFRYQWQRCNAAGVRCVNITGAVDRTYLVTNVDRSRTLRVVVHASNIEGVGQARSAQSEAVAESTAAQNTSRPTIAGDATVAKQLTAEVGTWTNDPDEYHYRWMRCDANGLECRDIQLAQAKNYQVRAVDIGFRIKVRILAMNEAGIGAAVSAPSGVVIPSVPVTEKKPALKLLSARFLGNRLYVRFRVCDDHPRNLRIFMTDSKPRTSSQVRRYSTVVPPKPCGVYTRSWVPAKKFRNKGRYTVIVQVRDYQGIESTPAKKTFTLK